MRKAASIILIVLSMVSLVGIIISMSDMPAPAFRTMLLWFVSQWIIYGGLLLAGGVFCLKRRYWGLCLVSALLTLSRTTLAAVEPLAHGSIGYFMDWKIWIMVIGALVATIFISLRKKEWQEISDSVDGKVSYDG
jgi:hypothetical protein